MDKRLGTTNIKIFIGVLIAVAMVVAVVALVRLDTTGEKGSGLGNEFIYDIEDLAKVEPNLILYEESAQPISTGLTDAHGIALDSQGSIYVAGDKTVRVLSDSGDSLDEIELTDMPRCLTVSDDGKIYVGMTNHVEVYDQQGRRLSSWDSLGERAVLTSIAVSKSDVFVADAGNRIVLRYDTTGRLINRIGAKDKARNIPGFVVPSPYFDLAVGRDGLLRVVNPGLRRIEAYTFDGDLEFWWGKFSSKIEDFCGCCNPVNFAILEDESFVTCEKGLIRVKIYDPEGAFVCVVASPEQLGVSLRARPTVAETRTSVFDVAVDEKGRIFILDTINNVVKIFTRKKA